MKTGATKEQIKDRAMRWFHLPIGAIQIILLLGIISFPFLLIWHSWAIAWKVGLSASIGMAVMSILNKAIKGVVDEAINDVVNEAAQKNLEEMKSTFNERLEQAKANRTK